MVYWAPRPSDLRSIYESLGYVTAGAYGWGSAQFVATGGRSVSGLTRANRLASFLFRSHANAIAGVLKTPLIRGGSMTIGSSAAAVTAGYLIGAVAGTGIARTVWGKSGQRDAIDFYTFQVSPGEYFDTLHEGFLESF